MLSEPARNPDNTADKAVSARYDRQLDASGTSSSLDLKGSEKERYGGVHDGKKKRREKRHREREREGEKVKESRVKPR